MPISGFRSSATTAPTSSGDETPCSLAKYEIRVIGLRPMAAASIPLWPCASSCGIKANGRRTVGHFRCSAIEEIAHKLIPCRASHRINRLDELSITESKKPVSGSTCERETGELSARSAPLRHHRRPASPEPWYLPPRRSAPACARAPDQRRRRGGRPG